MSEHGKCKAINHDFIGKLNADGYCEWCERLMPEEPMSCVFMGLPAEYMERCPNGYNVQIRLSDVPAEGHELSYLHDERRKEATESFRAMDGEIDFYIESLDVLEETKS